MFYYNLPKCRKTKFIGLIDGDDFIHKELGKILNKVPSIINMCVVQKGYAMFSKQLGEFKDPLQINKVYELDNFSNVCGSNRFFKADSFEKKIKRRLSFKIQEYGLRGFLQSRTVNNKFVDHIMININRHPDAWTILPNFFGIHRLVLSDGVSLPHHFMSFFNIAEIPIRSSIKFIHTTNHSCGPNNKNNQTDIISRYKKIGIIKKNDNGINEINKKILDFGLTHFDIIQN